MAKQQQRPATAQPKKAAAPAPVRKAEKRENLFSAGKEEFIFGRQNFIIMGAGLGLILLGLLLMAGGGMTDPNTWDKDQIYSFRRITLSPILMVAGFLVVAYGIFKKADAPVSESANPPAA